MINVLMSYHGTVNPFFMHQNFGPLTALSPEWKESEKLKDPARSRGDFDLKLTPAMGIEAADRMATDFHLMFELVKSLIMSKAPIKALPLRLSVRVFTPQEYAYDALLKARDGEAMIYFPFMGYDQGNLDRQFEMLKDENTVISLADTGAHCGVLSDASMPTFLLSHYAHAIEVAAS